MTDIIYRDLRKTMVNVRILFTLLQLLLTGTILPALSDFVQLRCFVSRVPARRGYPGIASN